MNTQVYAIIRYVMGEGHPRIWADDFYYETLEQAENQLRSEGLIPMENTGLGRGLSWYGNGYAEIKVLTRSDN